MPQRARYQREFTQAISVVLFGFLVLASPTAAQNVLIETATLTAARESVRIYSQPIRVDAPPPTVNPVRLPGTTHIGPSIRGANGMTATLTGEHSLLGTSHYLSGMSISAPNAFEVSSREIALENPRIAGITRGTPNSPSRTVLVGTVKSGPITGQGAIEVRPADAGPAFAFQDHAAQWLLPGVPAAAVVHDSANWVAALCWTPKGAAVLHVRDVVSGRIVQERAPVSAPQDQLEPAALSIHEAPGAILVILNATGPEAGDEGRCLAMVFDSRLFTLRGTPIEVTGQFTTGCSIVPSDDGAWWITTRTPSAGFAYVSRISPTAAGYERSRAFSYSGVTHPVRLAASGGALAVGVDRRVAVWPEGVPGNISVSYSAPITALAWSGANVVASEANRIHTIRAADGAELAMTMVQSGHIVDVHALDDSLQLPMDSDRDGIADSTDPEPSTPSPFLDLPARIALRADAAGREVRAVYIDSPHAHLSTWNVMVNSERTPWLYVFPRQGRVPGWFVAGIDPVQLPETGLAPAYVEIALTGTTPLYSAASSPARICVDVLPRSAGSRTVLWVLGKTRESWTESSNFSGAMQLLSGPPFYFSHEFANGGPVESFDQHAAVVIDSDAIDQGLLNRQALLHYIANGGGLLVLAGASDASDTVSQRWLAPLGVVIHPKGEVSGATDISLAHPLTRNWSNISIDAGARLQLDSAATVLAYAGDAPALAVRQFGRGRTVLMASPSPLLAANGQRPQHSGFMLDLFEWLSRALLESVDIDDDGIPDALEDRNANGIVDPGETNKLNPDSDGDGLIDGAEDQNADGMSNETETSPINPDTDGDGAWDGADYDPLPPAGAPTVTGLVPNSGPSEGGSRVSVDGRNLTADAAVWFGARPARVISVASTASLLVETPPADSPDGGPVDVRIEGAGAQSTILSSGFTYTPRSIVRLTLNAFAAARAQYEATVTLRLDAPAGVKTGRVIGRIDTDPPGELEWLDLTVMPEANIAGRRVVQRETRDWGIAFEVTPSTRVPDANELLTVNVRSLSPLSRLSSLPLVLRDVLVTAPNGEAMDVEIVAATINWQGAGP